MNKEKFLTDIEEFNDELKMNIDFDISSTPWVKSELGYIYSDYSDKRNIESQFRVDFKTHHPDAEIDVDFLISTTNNIGFIKFYLDDENEEYDVSNIYNTGTVDSIQTAKIKIPQDGNHFLIVSYEREDFVNEGLDLAEVHGIRVYDFMTQEEYDSLFKLERKTSIKTKEIPYGNTYVYSDELERGKTNVLQNGKTGSKSVEIESVYFKNSKIDEYSSSEEVVVSAVPQVIELGVLDGSVEFISDEEEVEYFDIEYDVVEFFDHRLELGSVKVLQSGEKGRETHTSKKLNFSDGTSDKYVSSVELIEPIKKIVLVGTKEPNSEELDGKIDEIIGNIKSGDLYKYEVKKEVREEEVPFEIEYQDSYELEVGEELVTRSGENGLSEITSRVLYVDGIEKLREDLTEDIILEPLSEIVSVGVDGEQIDEEKEHVLTKRLSKISTEDLNSWNNENYTKWETKEEDNRLPLEPSEKGKGTWASITIPIEAPTDNSKVTVGYYYVDTYGDRINQGLYSDFLIYVNDRTEPVELIAGGSGPKGDREVLREVDLFLSEEGTNFITIEFKHYDSSGYSGYMHVSVEWIHVFGMYNRNTEVERLKDVPLGSKIIMDIDENDKGFDTIKWTLMDDSAIDNNSKTPYSDDEYPPYAITLLSDEIVDVVSWVDDGKKYRDTNEFRERKFNQTSIGLSLSKFENILPRYISDRLIESRTSFLGDDRRYFSYEKGHWSSWEKLRIPSLGEISSATSWNDFYLASKLKGPINTGTATPNNSIVDLYNDYVDSGIDSSLVSKINYGDSIQYFARESRELFNFTQSWLVILILSNGTSYGHYLSNSSNPSTAGVRPMINIEPDITVKKIEDNLYKIVNPADYEVIEIVESEETIEEIIDIEFKEILIDEPYLPKGVTVSITSGENGTIKKTYNSIEYNTGLVVRELINSEIISLPVDKIVVVGTGEDSNYVPVDLNISFDKEILQIKDLYRENPHMYVGQTIKRSELPNPREGFKDFILRTYLLEDGSEHVYLDGYYDILYPQHIYYDVGTRRGGDVEWNPPVSPDGGRDKKKHILNNYIYLLNSETLEVDNIVDNYGSFSMTINYKSVGEFVIEIDNRLDSAKDMYVDRIIQFGASHRFVGIITRTEFSIDEEGNEIKVIKGRTIGDLLSRRVIWMPRTHRVKRYEGKSETIIKDVITDNIINPEDSDRKINNFTVRESKELGKDTFREYVYNSIEEVAEDLVSGENFGWEVFLDDDENELVFDILIGRDHSLSQEENPQVLFSSELGNIESQEYIDDESSHKNYVYIETYSSLSSNTPSDWNQMGEEGVSGIDRKEGYTKADTYRPELFPPDSPQYGVYPETIGEWYLTDTSPIQNFDAKAIDGKIFTYGRDYDIGDIVSIENKDWGIEVDLRIISVTVESSGEGMDFDVYLTFGDKIPRLTDRVKYEIENYDETANTSRRLVTSNELISEQRIREIIRQETSGGGGFGGGGF